MSEVDTALFKAAAEGDVPAIQSALQGGANINTRNPQFPGDTPLIAAAMLGREEAVRYLIQAGANISAGNGNKSTALHHAAIFRHLEVARILIRAHSDVNIKDNEGATPLVYLARDTELVRLLLEAGAEVNVKATFATPLIIAAHSGNAEAVKLLLQAGADVHATGGLLGYTALMSAAQGEGDTETMSLLIRVGADVNARREGTGETALMGAAFKGRTDAMRYLLAAGADVNARDNQGDTALHYAAKNAIVDKKNYSRKLTEMMRILVQGGAKVNTRNFKGETALWYLYCPECDDARGFVLSVGGRE
jgi:ankyrin repeat protein